MFSTASIPAVVGGTVPESGRTAFDQKGGGILRLNQVAILIKAPGAHTSFVATIEGSQNGADWFSLSMSALNPNLPFDVTFDEKGVGFSAALGAVGFVLNFEVAFPKLRFGLAGNGTDGGTGLIDYRSLRN